MSLRLLAFAVVTTALFQAGRSAAQQTATDGELSLRHIGQVKRDDLKGACTLTSSADGKYQYTAAWRTNSIVALRRDAATGGLAHVQTLTDEYLKGVVCIRLSPDGQRALGVSFTSKTVTLLSRDPESGILEVVHAAGPELAPGVSLVFPIGAVFSPDGKHVYAVDDRAGAVVSFAVTDAGRLEWLQFSQGRDGCFAGARALAACPDGKMILVGGTRAGTLCVLDRDERTGKVEIRQVLREGEAGINSLAGIHGISVSTDGKFVYTASGRFAGDQAVSAFRLGDDGKLSLIREFICDQSDLVDFKGGNNVQVSPDGLSVYACGTVSRSLACFRRNQASGDLSFLTTIRDDAQTGAGPHTGPADVDVSADGRFVYVTLEQDGAISIFERTVKR